MPVPGRSTASRTVFITAPDPRAEVNVSVTEVAGVNGPAVAGGLAGRAVLNPDIENPDIENPDIENPDIENPDIENAEVYNPDIENPDIENPDIENPDIENPDIENPDIENVRVANPDIENIGVGNPDIENPDIENPDIENPDIENPDIENGALTDVTWTVSNIGNTTSAFNVNMFLAAAGVPAGLKTQLIVYKVYKTPVLDPNGCDLRTETRNQIVFNAPDPDFISPGQGIPSQNDPSDKNATLWLAPGELGRVTLRVFDEDTSNNVTVTNPDGSTASIDPAFNPTTAVTVGVAGQGVDILDPPGATRPPVVTTTGTNLVFLQQPTSLTPGAVMEPPVSVRVYDNAGQPLPGVQVTLTLQNAGDAILSGGIATADASGIATFGALSVDLPVVGARLLAEATAPGVVAAGTSVPFDVAVPPALNWVASGDGLVTLLDDGAEGTPSFVYSHNGSPNFSGAWSLSRVATDTETVNLTYAWEGSHSFFQVTTGLDVFVNRGGTDVYLVPLENVGPYICCVTPSAEFSYAGATAVPVQAGDTFGFRLRGSHGDSAYTLSGTFSVTVGGSPLFPVNVIGSAGGGLLDSSSVFKPTRVFAGTLAAGQQVTITATGLVNRGGDTADDTPNGGATCDALGYAGCLNGSLPSLALLARVVNASFTGPWQFVGVGPTVITAPAAGFLEFGVNDNAFTDNTGAFTATVSWTVASGPAIASVSPSIVAPPNNGFFVVRGSGFPAPAAGTAVVTSGTESGNGFIFLSPSTTSAYWVRVPSNIPLGPATIQIHGGTAPSNSFPITVSATPGTPVITDVFNASLAPTTAVSAGETIYVAADGIDTLGVTVRFSTATGALIADISPSSTSSSETIGVASEVVVPAGVSSYPSVRVSIRQGSSAFSTPVTLSVPTYSAY